MSGIQRQIRNADALPRFELNPQAHRIGSDAEALAIARQLASESPRMLQSAIASGDRQSRN